MIDAGISEIRQHFFNEAKFPLEGQPELAVYKPDGAPAFAPNRWQSVDANCLAYALNLHDHGWAQPGELKLFSAFPKDISERINKEQWKTLVRTRVLHDGLHRISKDQGCPDDDHIIAVTSALTDEGPDFHAYVLHTDKSWSHLRVMDVGVRLFSFPDIQKVKNPEGHAFWEGYDFVGYFKVPEAGLKYMPRLKGKGQAKQVLDDLSLA